MRRGRPSDHPPMQNFFKRPQTARLLNPFFLKLLYLNNSININICQEQMLNYTKQSEKD